MAQPKRSDQKCALCRGANSSPAGEHVIPRWFWNVVLGDGPYTQHVNDEREKKKGGAPVPESETPYHVQLPCCLKCNEILNNRFELETTGFRLPVVSAFTGMSLTPEEARAASLWLLKTCLLMTHPEDKSGRNIQRIAWEGADQKLYEWMISDTDPPSDLGLFVHHFGPKRSGAAAATIMLPVMETAGERVSCQGASIGLLDWGFTLVYHPGWNFNHPSQGDQSVAQIWPPTGALDLSKISQRADWPLTFCHTDTTFDGTLMSTSNRPELSSETVFKDISGFLGEFRPSHVTKFR